MADLVGMVVVGWVWDGYRGSRGKWDIEARAEMLPEF